MSRAPPCPRRPAGISTRGQGAAGALSPPAAAPLPARSAWRAPPRRDVSALAKAQKAQNGQKVPKADAFSSAVASLVTDPPPLPASGLGQPDLEVDLSGLPPPVVAAMADASRRALDFTVLAAVASEVRAGWTPSRVEAVVQISPTALALRLNNSADTGFLQLSWDAQSPSVLLMPRELSPATIEPAPLAAVAQARLRGLILTGCDLPCAFDRVLRLQFSERVGEPPLFSLCFEPRGGRSLLALVEGDGDGGAVVAAANPEARGLAPRRPFFWPEEAPGATPSADSTSPAALREALAAAASSDAGRGGRPATLQRALVAAYRGVSPPLARELCRGAGVAAGAGPASLSGDQVAAVSGALGRWLDAVAAGSFEAAVLVEEGSLSVVARAVGVEVGGDACVPVPGCGGSVLSTLRVLRGRAAEVAQHGALRERLARGVESALKRDQSRVAAVRKQLSASEAHDEATRLGELLSANLYRIEPGMASIEVEDWETGEAVTLELDPGKRPHEQVEAFFKKARKQRRGVDVLEPLLREAEERVEWLQSVGEALSDLGPYRGPSDMAVLRQIVSELEEAGALPKGDGAKAQRAAGKEARATRRENRRVGSVFREFQAPTGAQVLVGRNNTQNDELSIKVARESDVWMHARHVPGAHVVLRHEGAGEPDDADVAFAAGLAVYFSKAKGSGRYDVSVCRGRDVKKPRGAKPGLVTVSREAVVVGVCSDAVLQAVEAAQQGA